MTSRRLWLLLFVLATPLALEAVTGCDAVLHLEPIPPRMNAYTCQCECNAGARERTITVSARADDAEQRLSDNSMLLGNNALRLNTSFLVGVRFAQIGVPAGAMIKSADVQFTASLTDSSAASIAIAIESADDAQTFTTVVSNISGRTYEPSPVSWSPLGWTAGVRGADERTTDLTSLIQAVVDRSGWTDQSSLVLEFATSSGSRSAVSFDGTPVNAPTLRVAYIDVASAFTADLPICLPTTVDPDTDPTALTNDCTTRVQNTYEGLVGACGYVADPATNCGCKVVETGFHDENKNGVEDSGEGYFTFTREICNAACTEQDVNLPADPNDPTRCNNFDPKGFSDCVAGDLATCAQNNVAPADCDTSNCASFVAATNAVGDDPVCIAHASTGPRPVAFQLFGRRSTCEVTGLSQIQVGDDHREPEQNPLTRGTIELLGGPCPGQSCVVGIATQFAMNHITFSVKFASDPTFDDLVQAGNSSITAATINPSGAGVLPVESAIAVGRGRRDTAQKAFFGSNESPVAIGVDWANFTCGLEGALVSTVNAEDPQGLCAGDNATICRHDSPDCDTAGGPCQLPPSDSEPLVVSVALGGTLVNQPPTANAGNDQTVECTSPAGASFLLDGTQSSDPDGAGDIRIVSWRSGSRTGAEIGFDRQVRATLGVGQSRNFVLRVIDGLGQADEDTVNVGVRDTTPPLVFCNAPSTITPPSTPLSFTATASDVCTAGVITPQITSFECFKFNGNGKRLDTTNSCKVTASGAKITIPKSEGVGNHIAWTAQAVDGTGNIGQVHCEVVVVNPGK